MHMNKSKFLVFAALAALVIGAVTLFRSSLDKLPQTQGDMNGDGKIDKALILSEDMGNGIKRYFAAVDLNDGNGYFRTNSFYIGDNIDPESIDINESAHELNVYYLARRKGEPLTAIPTERSVLILNVTKEGVLKGLMQ